MSNIFRVVLCCVFKRGSRGQQEFVQQRRRRTKMDSIHSLEASPSAPAFTAWPTPNLLCSPYRWAGKWCIIHSGLCAVCIAVGAPNAQTRGSNKGINPVHGPMSQLKDGLSQISEILFILLFLSQRPSMGDRDELTTNWQRSTNAFNFFSFSGRSQRTMNNWF